MGVKRDWLRGISEATEDVDSAIAREKQRRMAAREEYLAGRGRQSHWEGPRGGLVPLIGKAIPSHCRPEHREVPLCCRGTAQHIPVGVRDDNGCKSSHSNYVEWQLRFSAGIQRA
jgi:hypothetical protein